VPTNIKLARKTKTKEKHSRGIFTTLHLRHNLWVGQKGSGITLH